MIVSIKPFRAKVLAVSQGLLEPNQAQVCTNADVSSGELRPHANNLNVNKPTRVGTKKTIFKWGAVIDGEEEGFISNVSSTNPVVITSASIIRKLANGDRVFISDMTGVFSPNNKLFTVSNVTSTTFTLDGEDGTGYSSSLIGGKWIRQNGYWLTWLNDINVTYLPVLEATTKLLAFTSNPSDTVGPYYAWDTTIVSGSSTDYPVNYYTLGGDGPTVAPTLALGAGGGCTSGKISRAYVTTAFMSAPNSGYYFESNPSPARIIDGVCPLQTVDISAITFFSTTISSPSNSVGANIYRAVVGNNGNFVYRFVGSVTSPTTTFSDNVLDENLGAVLDTQDYKRAPASLKGMIALPNGVMAGFDKKKLYLTDFYLPHTWHNYVGAHYDITAIGNFDTSIVVCTEGKNYIASGVDPSSVTLSEIPIDQICVSKRSLASVDGFGVVFASPDGLVLIGPSNQDLILNKVLSRAQWQAYKPESILGTSHEGRYFGFYDNGTTQAGFIFDLRTGDFTDIDTYATAAYRDPVSDTLYLQIGDYICKWQGSTTKKICTWKSPKFQLSRPANLAVGQVIANSYSNLTFKLYVDGALKMQGTVLNNKAFRLPSGYKSRFFEVEVTGTDDIQQINLAETKSEMARV